MSKKLIILAFIIITVVVTILLITISHYFIDLHGEHYFGDGDSNIVKINAASIIILTALLLLVAYWQLEHILNQIKDQKDIAQSQFLLKIDERFGSSNIIKAKAILHKIYLKTKNKNEISGKIHTNEMGRTIVRDSPDQSEDFTYLMGLLNLLETLSYFANMGKINKKDVQDLLQGSLFYYYDVFEAWIYERRNKYHDKLYYDEFKKLVETLRSEPITHD